MRSSGLYGALALLMLFASACLGGCGSQGRTEKVDGFELQPFALPKQLFYFPPRISGEPLTFVATFAGDPKKPDSFGHFVMRGSDSRLSAKRFSLLNARTLYFATELLPGNRCLALNLGLWPTVWADRNLVHLYLFDLDTGEGKDITPRNLAEMALIQQDVPPRVYYDDVHGITFLMEDRGTLRIFAWRGGELVHQTDVSPKGVAGGFGFIGGKLTYGLVTRKREMLLYDHASGEFRVAEELKPLAGQVYLSLSVQEGTALNRFKEYVVPMAFAKDLAVCRTDTATWLVRSGKRLALTRQKAEGGPQVADDNLLPPGVTMEQALAARKQGQAAPASTLSPRHNLLAWDDEHVAIFDCEAQRLIVAGRDESGGK